MDSAIAFTVCSFFFSILLTIVYFSKERIQHLENKIYSVLIVSNLIGSVIHILCGVVTPMVDGSISSIIFSKIYLVCLLTWVMVFTIYVFVISKKSDELSKQDIMKYFFKIFRIFCIIHIVFIFLIFLLPLKIYNSKGIVYTYGPSVNCLYIISILCALVMIICMLCNLKNIISKKYFPIFAHMA